jgi:hypothetical protein
MSEIKEQKVVEQKFYPDLQFNRANRSKFFTLLVLLVACMGLVVGLMVSLEQYMFALTFGMILLITLFLIPSAIKAHPVKPGVPMITVRGRDVEVQGKSYRAQDIEHVYVTVLLNPVSKLDSENKEYVKKMAQKHPEEMMTGNVDIRLKKGIVQKNKEVTYTTVEDCLGACAAIIGAGVKHYTIIFNLKKINEKAAFSLTKAEVKKPTLSEVSEKDRRKQLI